MTHPYKLLTFLLTIKAFDCFCGARNQQPHTLLQDVKMMSVLLYLFKCSYLPLGHMDPNLCTLYYLWPIEQRDLLVAESKQKRKTVK